MASASGKAERYFCYKPGSKKILDVSHVDDSTYFQFQQQEYLFVCSGLLQKRGRPELIRTLSEVMGEPFDEISSMDLLWERFNSIVEEYRPLAKKLEAPKRGTIWVLEEDPDEASGIPGQAHGILVALNNGGGELSQGQLADILPGYIKTKQSPARILRFYRQLLLDKGYISIEER